MDKIQVTFYVDKSQPVEKQVYCMILGDVDLEKIVIEAETLEQALSILNQQQEEE